MFGLDSQHRNTQHHCRAWNILGAPDAQSGHQPLNQHARARERREGDRFATWFEALDLPGLKLYCNVWSNDPKVEYMCQADPLLKKEDRFGRCWSVKMNLGIKYLRRFKQPLFGSGREVSELWTCVDLFQSLGRHWLAAGEPCHETKCPVQQATRMDPQSELRETMKITAGVSFYHSFTKNHH